MLAAWAKTNANPTVTRACATSTRTDTKQLRRKDRSSEITEKGMMRGCPPNAETSKRAGNEESTTARAKKEREVTTRYEGYNKSATKNGK